MDAQAYLMRHGWSGPGNPLNKNQRPGPHGGLGLTKPILVARKANNHGVGKKTTKDATNQWWLRGFEDALKGVGQETPAAPTGSGNALTSELYRFFVRGEGLAGTLDKKNTKTPERTSSKSKRKRDAEDDGDERKAKKEEKAARKEEKKRRKLEGEDTAVEPAQSSESEKRSENKEERRARRKEKKEKKSRGLDDSSAGPDLTKDLMKKSKKSKRTASEEDYPTPMSTEQETDQGAVDTTKADDALEKAKAKKEKKESKKSKKRESETGGDSSSKKKSKKDKEKKSAPTA